MGDFSAVTAPVECFFKGHIWTEVIRADEDGRRGEACKNCGKLKY